MLQTQSPTEQHGSISLQFNLKEPELYHEGRLSGVYSIEDSILFQSSLRRSHNIKTNGWHRALEKSSESATISKFEFLKRLHQSDNVLRLYV